MKQGLRTAGGEAAMTARVLTADAAAGRLADPGRSIGLPGRAVRRDGAGVSRR